MLKRWCAPLGAGVWFLLVLLALAWLHNSQTSNELSGVIAKSFATSVVRSFLSLLVLREVLPLFLLVSLLLWLLALAWALFPFCLGWSWRARWTWVDGFLLTWGLLGTLHLALWWKVPSALWLIPGLNLLPFWLDFALLLPFCFTPMLWVARRSSLPWPRQSMAFAGWLVIAWVAATLPLAIGQRVSSRPRTVAHKPQMLILGVDSLRADVPELKNFPGTHYENAYTAIPATRLLFSILWGGDPQHYSVGHVFPDIDELNGQYPFTLLDALSKKGLKLRFYIDDGGTIGLAGRTEVFDEVLMPARGWENFVNSNLSGHVPLYAIFLDLLRVFPSTHPWASMDAGLRIALESGRGADLVMFHSCLAHIPSFLTRQELSQIPQWWTLHPKDLIPMFSLGEVDAKTTATWDARKDPYNLYQIRMRSILNAWAPIWKALETDPNYKGSLRILLSDHGERFYHATEEIRLGGVHGFDVDPWQARVPLVVAGPGFIEETRKDGAASLLNVRDVIGNMLLYGQIPKPEAFIAKPFAPIRYHTLDTNQMRTTEKKYYELSVDKMVTHLKIGSDGLWFMRYDRPATERANEVTVAQAFGDRLVVFKPLLKGGADRLEYRGYQLVGEEEIDQKRFVIIKSEIEKEFFKPWNSEH